MDVLTEINILRNLIYPDFKYAVYLINVQGVCARWVHQMDTQVLVLIQILLDHMYTTTATVDTHE